MINNNLKLINNKVLLDYCTKYLIDVKLVKHDIKIIDIRHVRKETYEVIYHFDDLGSVDYVRINHNEYTKLERRYKLNKIYGIYN